MKILHTQSPLEKICNYYEGYLIPRTLAGCLLLAKRNFCSRFKPNFPKNQWSIQVVLKIVLTVTGVVAVAKKNSTLGFSGKLMLSLDCRLSSMLQKFGDLFVINLKIVSTCCFAGNGPTLNICAFLSEIRKGFSCVLCILVFICLPSHLHVSLRDQELILQTQELTFCLFHKPKGDKTFKCFVSFSLN